MQTAALPAAGHSGGADSAHQSGPARRRIDWPRWRSPAALAVLMAGSAVLHRYRLGHNYLTPWDESVHAVVAQHVARDPLTPVLFEHQVIVPDSLAEWDSAHIWLHILPFGMWASGLSMRIFGETPLAMRLPGLAFVLIGMFASYFLGRRLSGPLAGLVAAFVVGYAPLALAIAQGAAFGDMTDTPLIGLTPVLVLAVVKGWQTGHRYWLVLAGLVQWLLYLTKGALGLAPLAVVVALFLSDLLFPREEGWRRPGWRGLLAFLVPALGLIEGSYLYFAHRFPDVMAAEADSWRTAFFHNFEKWGAPTDYPVTLYLYIMYGTALALVLAAAVAVSGYYALYRRSRADLVGLVWFAAVYLPIVVAVTKSPPMAVPAIGAAGLLIGRFVSLVYRSTSRRWQLAGFAVLGSAAVLGLGLLCGATFGQDYLRNDLSPDKVNPSGYFFKMHQPGRAVPYLILIGLALLIGGVSALVVRLRRARPAAAAGVAGRRRPMARLVATTAVLLALGSYLVAMDVSFVARPKLDPGPGPLIGPYLDQHLPKDATIFLDMPVPTDNMDIHDGIALMFWAHRDTYPVQSVDTAMVCPLARQAALVSSPAILVTRRGYHGPGTLIGIIHGWRVHRLAVCR